MDCVSTENWRGAGRQGVGQVCSSIKLHHKVQYSLCCTARMLNVGFISSYHSLVLGFLICTVQRSSAVAVAHR